MIRLIVFRSTFSFQTPRSIKSCSKKNNFGEKWKKIKSFFSPSLFYFILKLDKIESCLNKSFQLFLTVEELHSCFWSQTGDTRLFSSKQQFQKVPSRPVEPLRDHIVNEVPLKGPLINASLFKVCYEYVVRSKSSSGLLQKLDSARDAFHSITWSPDFLQAVWVSALFNSLTTLLPLKHLCCYPCTLSI